MINSIEDVFIELVRIIQHSAVQHRVLSYAKKQLKQMVPHSC